LLLLTKLTASQTAGWNCHAKRLAAALRVRVNGPAHDDMLEPAAQGITVDGEDFQPMTVCA